MTTPFAAELVPVDEDDPSAGWEWVVVEWTGRIVARVVRDAGGELAQRIVHALNCHMPLLSRVKQLACACEPEDMLDARDDARDTLEELKKVPHA